MTVLRESRDARIRGRYRQAAVAYLALGAAVVATTLLVPGMLSPERRAQLSPAVGAAALAGVLVVGLLVWRGHRKITLLASLSGVVRSIVFLLDGLGTHVEFRPAAPLPSSWTDVAALRGFLEAELATRTPFFETFPMPARPVLDLGGVAVTTAMVAFLEAALMAAVVLMLWRAVRAGPR